MVPTQGAGGQGVQRLLARADVGVAGVGAGRNGGQREARIERGGQVLERVDGEVDAAFGQRLFDLLDEDSLAVRPAAQGCAAIVFRGGAVGVGLLQAVAGGVDDLDLDGVAGGAQGVGDMVGLPERELGAARADADGVSHVTSRIRENGCDLVGERGLADAVQSLVLAQAVLAEA